MAYKCLECGHIFEDGEQAVWEERHGLDTPPYEKFSGCPLCKGAYEETKPCVHCGSEKLGEELYEGWCEECLREQIDYDTFFDYCEANNDEHYLDIFVMCDLLGGMDCPDKVTDGFHSLMVKCYKNEADVARAVENSLRRKTSLSFLDRCIRFIMDDDGSNGRDNFADWLNKKEVK